MAERRYLVVCRIKALSRNGSNAHEELVYLELDPPPEAPSWRSEVMSGSYGWTGRIEATRLTAEDAAAFALQFEGMDEDSYYVEEIDAA